MDFEVAKVKIIFQYPKKMYVCNYFIKHMEKETKLGIRSKTKLLVKSMKYQTEHSRVKIPDELIVSRFCANIKIALVIEF